MDGSIAEEFRPGPLLLDGILNTHKPDILDTISNLSNDEVFTPPRLANQVLDLLPTEIWSDPEIRILDPFCKTGVFLRESARRLIVGLADVIPNEAERRDHIFRNQLFGVAITELTWLMSRRSLYGTKDASSDAAAHLTARMPRTEGNIVFPHRQHDWDARGKCRICGIGHDIERQGRDNHAYALIHGGLEEEFGDMQFDVIIGNPPYQVKDGGHGSSASPIYHLSVQAAKALSPRFLSMIIPARWYAGGKGLDDFRAEMLSDSNLSDLVDIRDASEAFAGVELKGGICYFLRRSGKNEPVCSVRSMRKGDIGPAEMRNLNSYDVLIRDNEAISILEKVLARHTGGWMSEVVSSRKPFGFPTNFKDFKKDPFDGAVKIYANGGSGWIEANRVPNEKSWVEKWKVLISMAYNGGDALPHQIIGRPIIAAPGSCCTETYIVVNSFETEEEARNFEAFLRTRMARFLISLKKNTQHVTKDRFSFVPDLAMNREWTDEALFEDFGITEAEQGFVANMVKEL